MQNGTCTTTAATSAVPARHSAWWFLAMLATRQSKLGWLASGHLGLSLTFLLASLLWFYSLYTTLACTWVLQVYQPNLLWCPHNQKLTVVALKYCLFSSVDGQKRRRNREGNVSHTWKLQPQELIWGKAFWGSWGLSCIRKSAYEFKMSRTWWYDRWLATLTESKAQTAGILDEEKFNALWWWTWVMHW